MTEALLTLGAGILGLFAGALMNAKIMRTKESMEFTSMRACGVCAVPLKHQEMLPIVGYMQMKGRCRKCKAVHPWQYPATELVIGILFGIFAARTMLGYNIPSFVGENELIILFIRDAVMTVLLMMVFMFDYRAYIIPDRVTIPGMIIAILLNLWLGMPIESILLGGLLLGGFFAVQFLISNGKWVGGGDVRMGMLMGFLLGPILGIVGLFISYIVGAAFGITLILTGRRHLDSHVPFGTFLALATVICLLFGDKLVNWYLGFFS